MTAAVRALPLTFVIYLAEATLALLAALPLASGLAELLGAGTHDAVSAALLLEHIHELSRLGRMALLALSTGAVIALALGALLQLAWVITLDEAQNEQSAPVRVVEALARAAPLFGRALTVSAYVALALLAATLPFAGLAYALHRSFAAGYDARLHDLAIAAALAPVAVLALLGWIWHDLARAACTRASARESVRNALSATLRLRTVALALTLAAAGLALTIGAQALAGLLPSGALSGAASVLVLQVAQLARLFVRSVWLACAVERLGPRRSPEAARARAARAQGVP